MIGSINGVEKVICTCGKKMKGDLITGYYCDCGEERELDKWSV